MSIEKFKSQFADLLRPNYYEILISPPTNLNAQSTILSFLCSSTDFPFETIQTMEMITHSRKRMIASGVDFDPITVTFLLDSTGKVLDFFQKWKMLIIDDTFKMGYYEDYIGTIEIFMLDRQLQRVFGVKLKEAYPVNRNNISLSQNSVDTLSELPISFVYANSEYTMHNVLYPSATSIWNSLTRVYDKTISSISNSGLEQINDYLGKFGSSNINLQTEVTKLTSPFTNKINQIQSSIDNRLSDISNKLSNKYNIFDTSVTKFTSPVKKFTSNITKTINNIFKF